MRQYATPRGVPRSSEQVLRPIERGRRQQVDLPVERQVGEQRRREPCRVADSATETGQRFAEDGVSSSRSAIASSASLSTLRLR